MDKCRAFPRVCEGLVGKHRFLTPEQVAKLIRTDYTIIDLRSEDDYDSGHIDSAINIPHSVFMERWRDDRQLFRPGGKYVFVCYSGHTSTWVAAILFTTGLDTYTMKFGMRAVSNTDANPIPIV